MVKLLSVAIINLILIIDPKIIILGAYLNLPGNNELIVDSVRKNIAKSIPLKIPAIELSEPWERCTIMGSCFIAIENLLTGRFPYKISNGLDLQVKEVVAGSVIIRL